MDNLEKQHIEKGDQIFEKANQKARAYSFPLDNPYLTQQEVYEVNFWFQLPINLAFVVFVACAFIKSIFGMAWYGLIGLPIAVDLLSASILWVWYSQRFVFWCYMVLLHNWVLWFLAFVAIAWLLAQGMWQLAILVLFTNLVLKVPLFGWHLLLYALFSRSYGMNPRYAFFKKFYSRKFPFEMN